MREKTALIIDDIFTTLCARREEFLTKGSIEGSRTAALFEQGMPKIAKKFGEEAAEVIVEAMALTSGEGNKTLLIEEIADLSYFLFVMMSEADIKPEALWAELSRRHGLSEKQERSNRTTLKKAYKR